MASKSSKSGTIVVPNGARGGKVPPKWSKMEPLGVPWAPLGGPNGPKWSPWGSLGHPWGGLGASWGQQGLDISFLIDFGSLIGSFLEPKWRQKIIKIMPKSEVKNNTKNKYHFHESLMELGCQNV